VLDSDDEEGDGDWIVPESQRAELSLGKAGGSDDEDAEGGGEWIGNEDSDTDDAPESPSQRVVRQKPQVDEDSEDDIYLNPGDDDNQVLPSSKIRHLMKILRREAPKYKFIVFSVFTSMLDKVEPFLKRAGIGYARYDGSMRNDHREASLEKLRNNRATRVLLCSLRAGALGLNLTAASRVVILEPFWNPVSLLLLVRLTTD
jgi:SNF2 family DNA or RNA helicase